MNCELGWAIASFWGLATLMAVEVWEKAFALISPGAT
jgi:hypothetical protein